MVNMTISQVSGHTNNRKRWIKKNKAHVWLLLKLNINTECRTAQRNLRNSLTFDIFKFRAKIAYQNESLNEEKHQKCCKPQNIKV